MAVVFIHDVATKKWFEAGRTEALRDNHNPDWENDIIVDYFFEEEQKFRIEIYDKERSKNLNSFIGKLEFPEQLFCCVSFGEFQTLWTFLSRF